MAGSQNTRTLPAAHILHRMPTPILHAAVEALIDELDRRAGDPDMEEGGDLEYDIPEMDRGAFVMSPWFSTGRTEVAHV
ncbi:MAG: hypothetical protein RLY86_3281 [Pseudomonadota bacterium]